MINIIGLVVAIIYALMALTTAASSRDIGGVLFLALMSIGTWWASGTNKG